MPLMHSPYCLPLPPLAPSSPADTKPFITDLYDETAGTRPRPRSRQVIRPQTGPAPTAGTAAAAA